MEIRFLAGWKGLKWAAAVAGVGLLTVTTSLASDPAPVGNLGGPTDPSASEPGPKVNRPVLYPRSNYVWPFATGPNYGEVASERWNDPGVLHTRVGSFDLKRGEPAFPAELRTTNRLGQVAAQYFVLQADPSAFSDGRFDRVKASIESQGGAIVEEMPVAAFIVRLTASAFASIQAAPGVMALQPYHPAYKLSPSIGRAPLPNAEKALSEVYTLEAMLFSGEDATQVAIALGKLGANVLQVNGDVIRFEINRNRLGQVAALEPIASIHESLPIYPLGEESASSVETGRPGRTVGDLAYTDAGIDGGGNGIAGAQMLMVLDSGIQLDAGDLSDTRTLASPASGTHRKVRLYTNVTGFGGGGDLLGCDAPASGSFTHGHVVSSTALGASYRVPVGYGTPWTTKTDTSGNPWRFDGLAPGALLVAYDAGTTPALLGCEDPGNSGLNVGNIYTDNTPGSGSLGDGYSRGARISNFSWGSTNDVTYSTNSQKIDQFLFDNKDAMVFVSAGNDGSDTNQDRIPDPGTINAPATAKSAVVVGASNTFAADGTSGNSRAGFSSVGPATATSQRVAPLVMAPGTDTGFNGFASEYACRSSDNDQSAPVECDTVQGAAGTSFSSPAAAGAGLLVRDYFAQGFYPDGTSSNSGNAADLVPNVSGALVKATLIASADWMNARDANTGKEINDPGGGLTRRFRFNNEQGYGRIQMNKVLPLATLPSTPTGMVVCDGGIAGGKCNTSGISGTASPNATETYTFNISDRSQELRAAVAWVEDFGESLSKNLDLELVAPSGRTYWGNYFTDDNNRDNVNQPAENCDYAAPTPWPPASTALPDFSPWSIPTCVNSVRDTQNPNEAIFLSPDPAINGINDDPSTPGINEGADNQLEIGTWTLRVIGRTFTGTQPYALVMAGPVSLGSSVRLQRIRPGGALATGAFICNDQAQIDVNEVDEGTDPAGGLTPAEIASRVTVDVIDPGPDQTFDTGDDVIRDTETNLTFTDADGGGSGLKFSSADLILTDGTAPDPGNGALDIQSGWRVRVTYQDETSGVPDPNKTRRTSSLVDCRTQIAAGGVVWSNWGRDAFSLVSGGCEKDARGLFTFGFPDKYMDEGELIDYRLAFQSTEPENLDDVVVSLRPVAVDGDSPADCVPNSAGCADPNRANNPTSPYVTVLDSPKTLGVVRAGAAVSANFSVQVGTGIPADTSIEMLLGVSARKSGKPVESFAVSRHALNRDEVSFFYSTDFPSGGSEIRDSNNNENVENPTTDEKDLFFGDYVFESRTWSSLTATGKNGSLNSPWNFDNNDGGFRSGLHNATDTSTLATIAQWGEDRNFNNVLDAGEDRDTANGSLDQGWTTLGGCGWQTSNGTSRGVWHTGRIRDTSSNICTFTGNNNGRCQAFETFPGLQGASAWWELLLTPTFEKVNTCVTGAELNCGGRIDQPKVPVYTVEFLNMAWNASLDFADDLTALTWQLDTDTSTIDPVDLLNGGVLNALFGAHGARSGGNSPLTDGYPVFAPISACLASPDGSLRCGGFLGGSSCSTDQQCTGNTLNGAVGNNRSGQNSCFFEGKTSNVANAKQPLGLAEPVDDDASNGWCGRTDGLNGIDRQKSCNSNTDCSAAPYNGTCNKDDATVDNYVTANGPLRNMDITQVNGPDMRFSVLEDFYGDSGKSFQASLGFFVSEGTPSDQPVTSFGVAVDDLVVEWREFRLDTDTTPCGAGVAQCATINLSQTNTFEGNALIRITVLDASPYSPTNPVNDCNGDGDFTDVGVDDTDCNNNGITDVTVKVTSPSETTGEIAVLDRVGSTSEYLTQFPISGSYNSPGVLFISRSGTSNPVVTAQYSDRDDGTGTVGNDHPCGNNANLTQRGILQDATTVILNAGRISLKSIRLQDNGDNDGFADTNETVTMWVTMTNKSGQDLDDLTASLQSSDPKVECISATTVRFTDPDNVDPNLHLLPNKASRESLQAFTFKIRGDANRAAVNDRYTATFQLNVRSEKFDVGSRAIPLSMELDLDASGTETNAAYSESFESGTRTNFLSFVSQSLDNGKASVALSDGYRCQYNDPSGPNPNDPGRIQCFLGFQNAASNGDDWHIHDGSAADNNTGRAYIGTRSLHWGVHPATGAKRDTTRFDQLEAVRSVNPLNLPVSVTPTLSFKHQISLTDNRITNTPTGEAADRAVVAVQLADSAGTAIGNWIKIFPYENEYDAQGTDNFTNCTFDPIDDGNNEDSYFDPSDPFRRLGPSSTCFPEFVFAAAGDTDYQNSPADTSRINRAFDGPGLKGNVDRGVWVQPKFDLTEFRGRRVRLRFLVTTIEVQPAVTVNDTNIGRDNESGDDGWYLDDVQVPEAISSAITLAIDAKNNSGLPGCVVCTAITPSLLASPAISAAPGQPVEVDAGESTADACPSGDLQFKFWNDANGDGIVGNGGDVLLRDWTDNPVFSDAPLASTRYAVQVRCSTATSCDAGSNSAVAPVTVNCPSTGNLSAAFNGAIGFSDKNTISWTTSQSYDAIRGNLNTLRSSAGNFTGTVLACLANDQTGTSVADATSPAVGSGFYYLTRPTGAGACNAAPTWSSKAPKEQAGRDSEIGADANACP